MQKRSPAQVRKSPILSGGPRTWAEKQQLRKNAPKRALDALIKRGVAKPTKVNWDLSQYDPKKAIKVKGGIVYGGKFYPHMEYQLVVPNRDEETIVEDEMRQRREKRRVLGMGRR